MHVLQINMILALKKQFISIPIEPMDTQVSMAGCDEGLKAIYLSKVARLAPCRHSPIAKRLHLNPCTPATCN